MQMSNQRLFQFHKVLLILLTVQVQADPTFDSIALIASEDTRPTGSSGGYIDGIDKFVVEFIFTRADADITIWPDNKLDPQKLIDGTWTPMTCRYDAGLCPGTPGECYCKSRVGDVFTFVYNPNASSDDSGVKFRVSWEPTNFILDPVRTTEFTLPDVCSQLSVTYTTLGETKVAGVTNTVEKPSGNATLTYTVGGLEGSYTIKIQKNGTDVATSTTNTVTTNVDDADLLAEFSLWYTESTSAPGCGRSGSGLYTVTYTEETVPTTDPATAPPTASAAESGDGGDDDLLPIILGCVFGALAVGLLATLLFACFSRATDVKTVRNGAIVNVNWSGARFPFRGETVVVEKKKKGVMVPVKSKMAEGPLAGSKRHAASLDDIPVGTYTVSVVTNRWGWNTKSKPTPCDMKESPSERDGQPGPRLPPLLPSPHLAMTGLTPDNKHIDERDKLVTTENETKQKERKKKKKKSSSSPDKSPTRTSTTTAEEAENMANQEKDETTEKTKRKHKNKTSPEHKNNTSPEEKTAEELEEERDGTPRPLPKASTTLPPVRNPRPVPLPNGEGVNTSVSSPHGMETHFVTHSQSPIAKNRPTSIEVTRSGQ